MKYKLIFLFIMFLMIPMVSALDFDNVKEYSDDDRKVTITNAFGLGDKIAEIELITPRINRVLPGDNRKVMIWEVENFGDLYVDGLKEMDILNMKTDRLEGKSFHYELAVYEDVEVETWDTVCDKELSCIRTNIESHTENKITSWIRYNTQDLPKGNLTIALVTDVDFGDHYDGIPTIFGEKLTRWAEWTEALNEDIILYYALDERTGTKGQENVTGVFNGTTINMENADWVTGKIGRALDFDGVDERFDIGNAFTGMQNMTISMWVNVDTLTGNKDVVSNAQTGGSGDTFILRQPSEDTWIFAFNIDGTSGSVVDPAAIVPGTWYNIVGTYNGTATTMYKNGVFIGQSQPGFTNLPYETVRAIQMGDCSDFTCSYDGLIDEVAFWNRTLSQSEVTQLYNGGDGIQFIPIPSFFLDVELTLPLNNTNQSIGSITFNSTSTLFNPAGFEFFNSTLFVFNSNFSLFGTNTTSFTGNTTNDTSLSLSGFSTANDFNWNYLTCVTNGTAQICEFDESNRTFNVLPTGISITLDSPADDTTHKTPTLFFSSDIALSTPGSDEFVNNTLFVWHPNSTIFKTNTTLVTGISNSSNLSLSGFTTTTGFEWNYFACAGTGPSLNCNFSTSNLTFNIATPNNSHIFNASTFETSRESYALNITPLAGTLTSAIFHFNTTEFTGTILTVGNDAIATAIIDIPLLTTAPGSNNIFWELGFSNGGTENTDIETVFVNSTNFTLSTGVPPLNIPFLNISFRNETLAQEFITATIDSTFTYYLGSGAVNKTLIFQNATENFNYIFVGVPVDRTLNIIESLAYNNGESQQRNFETERTISNTTTIQTLYLLPTSEGLFSPFRVEDTVGNVLVGVKAVISRTLGGEIIDVNTGLTDGSGFISIFLDPDITYTGTFTKSGFTDTIFTFVPTADTRTVVMGTGITTSVNGTVLPLNTTYIITPTNTSLQNNTDITFGFDVTSSQTISLISMNITNSSGFQLGFESNAGTGSLSDIINTNNLTIIVGEFIIIGGDDETLTISKLWIVGNEFVGDYSLFNQLTLYNNYGFSDFWRLLLVLIVII